MNFSKILISSLIISLLLACEKNEVQPFTMIDNNIVVNTVEERNSESEISRSDMDLHIAKIEQNGSKIDIQIKMGGCEDIPRLSFFKRKVAPNVRYSYDFFHIKFKTDKTCEKLNTYTLKLDINQINFASNTLKIRTDSEEQTIQLK